MLPLLFYVRSFLSEVLCQVIFLASWSFKMGFLLGENSQYGSLDELDCIVLNQNHFSLFSLSPSFYTTSNLLSVPDSTLTMFCSFQCHFSSSKQCDFPEMQQVHPLQCQSFHVSSSVRLYLSWALGLIQASMLAKKLRNGGSLAFSFHSTASSGRAVRKGKGPWSLTGQEACHPTFIPSTCPCGGFVCPPERLGPEGTACDHVLLVASQLLHPTVCNTT